MYNFYCSQSVLSVAFTRECTDLLQDYRQTFAKNEAGGMLFCRDLDAENVYISEVSLPGLGDVRRRHYFKMDGRRAQSIILEKFSKGLHYVGDWHTHPQFKPTPSPQDIRSINDVFRKSQHDLRYLVLLVLSSDRDFRKSFVGLADGAAVHGCQCRG